MVITRLLEKWWCFVGVKSEKTLYIERCESAASTKVPKKTLENNLSNHVYIHSELIKHRPQLKFRHNPRGVSFFTDTRIYLKHWIYIRTEEIN